MLAVAALSSTPSQGEGGGGAGPASRAPAEPLLGRGAGGAKLTPTWQKTACGFSPWGRVGSQTMQKESGFRPSRNWSHLLSALWHAGLLGRA